MSYLEYILKWIENDQNYEKFITILVLTVLGLAAIAEAVFDKKKS
ncbi:hypothetical protein [Dyadobacter sp. CY312]|nr:hypothetical protein [Dyadobacter sp. CY312]